MISDIGIGLEIAGFLILLFSFKKFKESFQKAEDGHGFLYEDGTRMGYEDHGEKNPKYKWRYVGILCVIAGLVLQLDCFTQFD